MIRLIKKITLYEKIFYPLLVIFFIFLIQYSISPLQKRKEYNRKFESDTLFSLNYKPVFDYPDLISVVRDRSYREALLDLAVQDSINLSLSLVDSTICLYIKGVKIHQSKIMHFKKDRFFENMPNSIYTKLFSHGLNINSYYATIVKEPIVVRHAPKDTSEAALNVWKPDTLIQNPAFLRFNIDYGIRLIFEQDANPSARDKWMRFRFHSELRSDWVFRAFSNFVLLRKQEYQPTITIKMPVDDLRSVFRALPRQTSVAIRF